MKDIPAQYHSFRKTTLGDNIISFRVDQMYSDTVGELVQAQIGTEYIMKLEDVTTGVVLGGNKQNDGTKERFRKQLFAKMNDWQERSGDTELGAKERLFRALKKRGIEVTSRKDLDLKGLAIAVSIVESWLEA